MTLAVGKSRANPRRAFDDVTVREDESVGSENEPGTRARLLGVRRASTASTTCRSAKRDLDVGNRRRDTIDRADDSARIRIEKLLALVGRRALRNRRARYCVVSQ